jgi:sigma-B regulation protein RsbU (phosphoserine phosphatase)
MILASPPRMLLCADQPSVLADIPPISAQNGPPADVDMLTWGAVEPHNLASYQVIVIDGSRSALDALQCCRRLQAALGECFVPTLFLTGNLDVTVRLAGLDAGADACLARPFSTAEFLAQIQALLRIKEKHDRLAAKTAEIYHTTKRLQLAHQRVNQELELARRIQLSFLPQSLPELPHVRFAVHYRPCGRVGGDFYDVFRLDEHHVGFYVADAMGHGVPASLLTMFLKKGVKAKEIYQKEYRLVPPGEVLQRLNHDLLEQGIVENAFITMVYALFNDQEGTLVFSRAGHPHPVYLPAGRDAQVLEVAGSLLGVFETKFSVQNCQLRTGDKALFYTDGTDAVSFNGHAAGTESFLACVNRHRALPIAELVDRLAADLCHQAEQPDDFTLLGLELV